MNNAVKVRNDDSEEPILKIRLWSGYDDAMTENLKNAIKHLKEILDGVEVYGWGISTTGNGKIKITMEAEVRK